MGMQDLNDQTQLADWQEPAQKELTLDELLATAGR